LRQAFDSVETDQLVSHLEGSEEGRAFLVDFGKYLDEFGWRSDVFELSDKTWREDPIIPLNTLQGYVLLDDSADPDVKYGEAVALRDKLLAQARDRLANDPEKLGQFNGMYDAARHYLPITENHNYYIDQIGNSVMRLPILELGRRLVAINSLGNVDDAFFLYLADIRAGLGGTDQKALVTLRKSDMEQWSKVIPVPVIGEPPEPHGDPMEAALGKMFGMPVEPSTDPNVINGIGASPGTVQGRAKVVRTLSEASKVQPGDILICEMTMPAWTPLFSIASAVVADTGGVLSHCAIVSREYGMPCVVGTLVGTAALQDGMLLTVDGSQGVVRIDSR
jgi:pyruvate,water dikinase